MTPRVFYEPKGDGREAPIKQRLEAWRALRAAKSNS